MRYAQVVFSPTGGTERVADIVSGEWSETVETVDLCDGAVDFSKCTFEEGTLC